MMIKFGDNSFLICAGRNLNLLRCRIILRLERIYRQSRLYFFRAAVLWKIHKYAQDSALVKFFTTDALCWAGYLRGSFFYRRLAVFFKSNGRGHFNEQGRFLKTANLFARKIFYLPACNISLILVVAVTTSSLLIFFLKMPLTAVNWLLRLLFFMLCLGWLWVRQDIKTLAENSRIFSYSVKKK